MISLLYSTVYHNFELERVKISVELDGHALLALGFGLGAPRPKKNPKEQDLICPTWQVRAHPGLGVCAGSPAFLPPGQAKKEIATRTEPFNSSGFRLLGFDVSVTGDNPRAGGAMKQGIKE